MPRSSGVFPSGIPIKPLHVPLLSAVYATFPTSPHLQILYKELNLWKQYVLKLFFNTGWLWEDWWFRHWVKLHSWTLKTEQSTSSYTRRVGSFTVCTNNVYFKPLSFKWPHRYILVRRLVWKTHSLPITECIGMMLQFPSELLPLTHSWRTTVQ